MFILEKEVAIEIIGLGNKGLPLALVFANSRYKVFGVDNDSELVEKLNQSKNYLAHETDLDPILSKVIKELSPQYSFLSLINLQDTLYQEGANNIIIKNLIFGRTFINIYAIFQIIEKQIAIDRINRRMANLKTTLIV